MRKRRGQDEKYEHRWNGCAPAGGNQAKPNPHSSSPERWPHPPEGPGNTSSGGSVVLQPASSHPPGPGANPPKPPGHPPGAGSSYSRSCRPGNRERPRPNGPSRRGRARNPHPRRSQKGRRPLPDGADDWSAKEGQGAEGPVQNPQEYPLRGLSHRGLRPACPGTEPDGC